MNIIFYIAILLILLLIYSHEGMVNPIIPNNLYEYEKNSSNNLRIL